MLSTESADPYIDNLEHICAVILAHHLRLSVEIWWSNSNPSWMHVLLRAKGTSKYSAI